MSIPVLQVYISLPIWYIWIIRHAGGLRDSLSDSYCIATFLVKNSAYPILILVYLTISYDSAISPPGVPDCMCIPHMCFRRLAITNFKVTPRPPNRPPRTPSSTTLALQVGISSNYKPLRRHVLRIEHFLSIIYQFRVKFRNLYIFI